MRYAAISADVVSYTAFAEPDRARIREALERELQWLCERYGADRFFGRTTLGDQIECVLTPPAHALRIALQLKALVKSIERQSEPVHRKRIKYFKEHGLRVAVAVGDMERVDQTRGILEGPAIYMSGRKMKGVEGTAAKQRVIIKETLFFLSDEPDFETRFGAVFGLLDHIFSQHTVKQSRVVRYRLQGLSEQEICEKLGRSQSTVNKHSTTAGWQSIAKAVQLFEQEFGV